MDVCNLELHESPLAFTTHHVLCPYTEPMQHMWPWDWQSRSGYTIVKGKWFREVDYCHDHVIPHSLTRALSRVTE